MGFIIGFLVLVVGSLVLGTVIGMGILVYGSVKRTAAPRKPMPPMKARASQEAARARVIAEARERNPWLETSPERPLTEEQKRAAARAKDVAEIRARYPWLKD